MSTAIEAAIRQMQARANACVVAIMTEGAESILKRPQHIERFFPGRVAPTDLDDLHDAIETMWAAEKRHVQEDADATTFRATALQEVRIAMNHPRFPSIWSTYIARRDA